MTLQTSGAISLDNLQTEFGGPSPIPLTNYYRGGNYVPNTSNNNNIPTSGAVSIESFYGTESTITGAISGGGTVSNSNGSAGFGLTASTNFNSPSYSWSTTAGTLSATTGSSVTLTLSAGDQSSASATVSCTMSSSGKSTTHTAGCTYTNTATANETVSISGGGSATVNSAGSPGHTFALSASGTPITPSSYSWSTTTGTLSATTGANVSITVYASAGTTNTATVTCVMTVNGVNHTATTMCSVTNKYCFSGCTRILTDRGYMRFDELPSEFYVINHTGTHLAKLLVHENSLEPMRRMGKHLVTERHLFKVGENWVPASELFHERAPIEPRTVYNCHVLTDNVEDHHYLLENGLTAHNIKA